MPSGRGRVALADAPCSAPQQPGRSKAETRRKRDGVVPGWREPFPRRGARGTGRSKRLGFRSCRFWCAEASMSSLTGLSALGQVQTNKRRLGRTADQDHRVKAAAGGRCAIGATGITDASHNGCLRAHLTTEVRSAIVTKRLPLARPPASAMPATTDALRTAHSTTEVLPASPFRPFRAGSRSRALVEGAMLSTASLRPDATFLYPCNPWLSSVS